MRSGSHVQLAALRNRDLELQTTSPFSNHGSVERSTACFRHKNVLQFCWVTKFPVFFCVTLYLSTVRRFGFNVVAVKHLKVSSTQEQPAFRTLKMDTENKIF